MMTSIINMKYKRILFPLAGLVLACALCVAGAGAQGESGKPTAARIEPAADELLRKMSDKLAGAKQFTVAGERTQDNVMEEDSDKGTAKFEIDVQRPSGLKGKVMGDGTARTLFFDGQQATLLDENNNIYASVALAGTNEEMLDALHEKYGFAPPLVDFMVPDPYANLTRDVLSGREQGKETVNGAECRHLAFQQENTDWELWIAESDLLPRKFVIGGRDKQGAPQLTVVFTQWDLAPKLSAGSFSFKPPQGAEKTEMIPKTNPENGAETDAAPTKPERK